MRRTLSIILAVVLAALAVGAPAASADDRTYYHHANANSTLCLAAAGGGTANGTKVIQWPCRESNTDQMWHEDSNGLLINRKSGKCLAVPNNSALSGVQLHLWTCDVNNPAMSWNRTWLETNKWAFINDWNGLAVAVGGGSFRDGAPVIQWVINGSLDQRWFIKHW